MDINKLMSTQVNALKGSYSIDFDPISLTHIPENYEVSVYAQYTKSNNVAHTQELPIRLNYNGLRVLLSYKWSIDNVNNQLNIKVTLETASPFEGKIDSSNEYAAGDYIVLHTIEKGHYEDFTNDLILIDSDDKLDFCKNIAKIGQRYWIQNYVPLENVIDTTTHNGFVDANGEAISYDVSPSNELITDADNYVYIDGTTKEVLYGTYDDECNYISEHKAYDINDIFPNLKLTYKLLYSEG